MLMIHVVLGVAALVGLFALNRFVTPDRFWAHWVALAWLPALLAHGVVFARSTLQTMGAGRR
jgi:hypothetical protein